MYFNQLAHFRFLRFSKRAKSIDAYFLKYALMFWLFFTAVIPVAAATMTPLPLLASLIILKIRDHCQAQTKIPLSDEDDRMTSIIKTAKVIDEVKESESKMKLVNGDANDNSISAWTWWSKHDLVIH